MEDIQEMTEQVLADQVIQKYFNLQRIKHAVDRDKELDYQEKVLKARLQSLGVPTEELEF